MTVSKPVALQARSGKPITRALVAALAESAPGADAPNLRRIVDNLIGKAIDGDLAAIREIFDRIDGKAPTAATGGDAQEPRKVMFEWKSNE
jgi:ribosomal protein L17